MAEVLITLAIIGVVAALTIPTLMADSRYQLISSRIAKFRSVTEDAALAFNAMNNDITVPNISKIIIYKDVSNIKYSENKKDANGKDIKVNGQTVPDETSPISEANFKLKDDTEVFVKDGKTGYTILTTYGNQADASFKQKYGTPAIALTFKPNVNGLSTVQNEFKFIMTDKGYVMPDNTDYCLKGLLDRTNNGKLNKELAKTKGTESKNGCCVGTTCKS